MPCGKLSVPSNEKQTWATAEPMIHDFNIFEAWSPGQFKKHTVWCSLIWSQSTKKKICMLKTIAFYFIQEVKRAPKSISVLHWLHPKCQSSCLVSVLTKTLTILRKYVQCIESVHKANLFRSSVQSQCNFVISSFVSTCFKNVS